LIFPPRPLAGEGSGVRGARLSLAAFVHLHWFWTASPRFWAYAQLGKMAAAAAIVASLAALGYAMLAL
jgi:hypothetical protein